MTADAETVKLDQFEQKFFLRLNKLRQEDRYCDVRFDINGKIFPCHRLVLVTASAYFDTMFNGHFKESSSDTILMNEMEAEAFEEILNAMYTASIRLLPSNVYFILKASHLLLLETVENACVSYIMKNCASVYYLVDACLFAKNIQQMELYSKCIRTITADLINYSKTDSFTQIPIDVLKSILSKWKPKDNEEESTVLLMSKWSKENGASREDMLALLELSHLATTNYINPVLMVQLLETSDSVNIKNETSLQIEPHPHLDLNIYLNVVDVKTGQKGWAVLKINDKFDNYALSSFYVTNAAYKRVCKVRSKLYCFEYFADGKKRNVFSCYDKNDNRTLLPLPEHAVFQYYKLASMGTSIYLMSRSNNCFIVWVYDCDLKTWKNTVRETDRRKSYDDVTAYTFMNGIFYLVAVDSTRIGTRSLELDYIYSIDSDSAMAKTVKLTPYNYYQYIICAFDDKIALWGCNDGDYNYLIEILDLTTDQWLPCRKPMNVKRKKFRMIYHKGFLYVVENNRAITNEKYDFETNTWTELPSLPKRVTLRNKNGGASVLHTGSVFGSDCEAIPK